MHRRPQDLGPQGWHQDLLACHHLAWRTADLLVFGCASNTKNHHVKQILAIPGWMEWKPLNDFMRGISGNMGLSESQFECALNEVKYYMEFGKMPSVEDLAPEHF